MHGGAQYVDGGDIRDRLDVERDLEDDIRSELATVTAHLGLYGVLAALWGHVVIAAAGWGTSPSRVTMWFVALAVSLPVLIALLFVLSRGTGQVLLRILNLRKPQLTVGAAARVRGGAGRRHLAYGHRGDSHG